MYHAAFRVVDGADLPPEWLVEPPEELCRTTALRLGIPRSSLLHSVCVVLPQCSLATEYMQWTAGVRGGGVGVMLTHPGAFADSFGEASIHRCIEHLVRTRQPSTDFVQRFFGLTPADRNAGRGRRRSPQ